MPAFLLPLIPLLSWVIVSAAGRILAGLGFAVITFYGVGIMTESLMNYMQTFFNLLPSPISNFVEMFQVWPCIKMILSAYVGQFSIRGMRKLVML